MMAHEIPLPIHQTQYKTPPDASKKAAQAKTDKNLKGNDGERRLPNGEKVNFGNGSSAKPGKSSKSSGKKDDGSKKKNRSTSPALPNGGKPNFGHEGAKDSAQGQSKKKGKSRSLPDGGKPNFDAGKDTKKKSEPSLPNGEKPNFFNDKAVTTKTVTTKAVTSKKGKSGSKDKKIMPETTYAGSSFHSSPEALALPKPSFKTSPKPGSGLSEEILDVGTSVSSNSSPSSRPIHPPPQHPVTAYPPGSIVPPAGGPMYHQPQPPYPMPPNQFIQPGFVYNYSPQGYIQYQYPPGGGHFPQMQPPAHMQNPIITHFQQPLPPVGQEPANTQVHPQVNGGQRISFNDLLGSTKG